MGLRLTLLGFWTPKYIIRRELRHISDKTNSALIALLPTKTSEANIETASEQPRNIFDLRAEMAKEQVKLVETLVAAIGREETVKRGRNALFLVGQALGRESRTKLGVGDSIEDLEKAAKILYRILGIDFHMKRDGDSDAEAIIDSCALAENYSELTCEVLSATDEGVINGLQPNVTMLFTQHITGGCKNCKAAIHFENGENKK